MWNLLFALTACTPPQPDPVDPSSVGLERVLPRFVTDPVPGDADDPALWLHPTDLDQSLVIGTDKEDPGGVYLYDLTATALPDAAQLEMESPNNIDVQTGFAFGGELIDIAVVTEMEAEQLRVYRMPDMIPIDGGGLPMFVGESGDDEEPSGVGLYQRPGDGSVFAHVSRRDGPASGYLHTYELADDGAGAVQATFIGAFGAFSGSKDIEAVLVDDALGVLYYSDELDSVRKYPADPDDPAFGVEIARFAVDGFTEAREGLALFAEDDGTGFLIVSDQTASRFHVYPREGSDGDPHAHPRLGTFTTEAVETDGMDASPLDFGGVFDEGLFVCHSDEGRFHLYAWSDILAGMVWE